MGQANLQQNFSRKTDGQAVGQIDPPGFNIPWSRELQRPD